MGTARYLHEALFPDFRSFVGLIFLLGFGFLADHLLKMGRVKGTLALVSIVLVGIPAWSEAYKFYYGLSPFLTRLFFGTYIFLIIIAAGVRDDQRLDLFIATSLETARKSLKRICGVIWSVVLGVATATLLALRRRPRTTVVALGLAGIITGATWWLVGTRHDTERAWTSIEAEVRLLRPELAPHVEEAERLVTAEASAATGSLSETIIGSLNADLEKTRRQMIARLPPAQTSVRGSIDATSERALESGSRAIREEVARAASDHLRQALRRDSSRIESAILAAMAAAQKRALLDARKQLFDASRDNFDATARRIVETVLRESESSGGPAGIVAARAIALDVRAAAEDAGRQAGERERRRVAEAAHQEMSDIAGRAARAPIPPPTTAVASNAATPPPTERRVPYEVTSFHMRQLPENKALFYPLMREHIDWCVPEHAKEEMELMQTFAKSIAMLGTDVTVNQRLSNRITELRRSLPAKPTAADKKRVFEWLMNVLMTEPGMNGWQTVDIRDKVIGYLYDFGFGCPFPLREGRPYIKFEYDRNFFSERIAAEQKAKQEESDRRYRQQLMDNTRLR